MNRMAIVFDPKSVLGPTKRVDVVGSLKIVALKSSDQPSTVVKEEYLKEKGVIVLIRYPFPPSAS